MINVGVVYSEHVYHLIVLFIHIHNSSHQCSLEEIVKLVNILKTVLRESAGKA